MSEGMGETVGSTEVTKTQRPQRRAKVRVSAKYIVGLMSTAAKYKADIRFTPQGQIMGYVTGLGSAGVIYNTEYNSDDTSREAWQEVNKLYPDGCRIIGLGGVDALRVYKAYATLMCSDDDRAEIDVVTGNIVVRGKTSDGRTVTIKSAMFIAEVCDAISDDYDTLVAVDYTRYSSENDCAVNTEALRVIHNLALRSKLPEWQRIKVGGFDGYTYAVGGGAGTGVACAIHIEGEHVSINPRLVDITELKAYGQVLNKDDRGVVASLRHYFLTTDDVILVEHSIATTPLNTDRVFGGYDSDDKLLDSDAVAYLCDAVKRVVPGYGAAGQHRVQLTCGDDGGKAVVYNDRQDVVAELDLDEYTQDFDIHVDPALLAVIAGVGGGLNVPKGSRGASVLRYVGKGVMAGVAPLKLATPQ